MFRVLIVDDEDFSSDGIESFLNLVPGIVVDAKLKNGLEAKEYLDNHRVDAVFSDIRMPVMDGLQLAKYLSDCKVGCKVVLISAYSEFAYAQKAIKYGVKYYLTKPIRKLEIKDVVEHLIAEKNEQEQENIWRRDINKELIELEMYHAIIDKENYEENGFKESLFFNDYLITIKNECGECPINTELLEAGFINIFRWYLPNSIPLLVKKEGHIFRYRLLGNLTRRTLSTEEVKECVKRLMKIEVEVNITSCSDVNELKQGKKAEIEQDQISDAIIQKAKEYIDIHLMDDFSREDVANAVFLDSSYFSRYFKKKCGINFKNYVLEKRIEKVKYLLETGYKVNDAAKEAGFQNGNYFNKLFKQHVGVNPTEYKKQMHFHIEE